MVGKDGNLSNLYWGWESPSGQLRGHFLGHYLSACAYMWAETGDEAIKQRADFIVSELARCQEINGGEWVGSIPEKYLYLMADGRPMWSPQYTLHKTLMGLYDMYAIGGNKQALEVLDKMANWMHRWTSEMIDKGKADAILNGETSGMLEIWAAMYDLTGKQKYRDLMERYGHPWLFTQLLKGEDALSLDHCNASIPWSHGSARCYEATGDPYWKQLTEDFWKCAVLEREQFATGGQSAGEHWIPKGQLAAFAGENNQEHCTVYNMMRTANYLYKWTGDVTYADFIERNLYNGILAQQHPETGMVAYFLPMASGYKKGGEKGWGHPTMDFYCCHGSLVQAQTRYLRYIYYEDNNGLTISQYIPSHLSWQKDNAKIDIEQDFEGNQWTKNYNAPRWRIIMTVKTDKPVTIPITLRLPWWLDKKAKISVNGNPIQVNKLHGYIQINRTWNNDQVVIEFADRLWAEPLPGSKTGEVAFMEGPIVLASPLIQFRVEFWDRTPLKEQQTIFGRDKQTGAPLGMQHEHDVPDYASDPEGKVIALDSHIRLANPRTPESESSLMLRRGYSYSLGVTNSGQLDMGLLFVCYQHDLEKGFLTVQKRLNGEALEEYVKPIGGGYFFALPGVKDANDYLGSALLRV